jgi:hypothetical protein
MKYPDDIELPKLINCCEKLEELEITSCNKKSTMESKTFAETSARRYRIVDAEMFFFAKNWIQ